MKLLSARILIASMVLTAAIVALPLLPLGVPGEWQWQRHEPLFAGPLLPSLDRVFVPAVLGSIFLFFAVWADKKIPTARRPLTVLLYGLLLVVSWSWLNAVQSAAPATHRAVKPCWVLYDPASSGYFFEAAFRMDSTSEFLAGYEARMAEGEVLHVGTHPPGLFLLSAACLESCRRLPVLVSLIQAINNRESTDAFRQLESGAGYALPLDSEEVAALQLLSLISCLAVVAAGIPLALLSRQLYDATTAWRLSCVWPTLPCLAVFLPKSDLLFPLTSMLIIAGMFISMEKTRRLWLAVPSGLVLWLGLMFSLAHLPLLFLLTAFAGLRAMQSRGATVKRHALALGLMVSTTLLTSVAWNVVTECNLFQVWQMNLSNHEGFYAQFTRTGWKWILVNPLELALAVGLPVFLLIPFAAQRATRRMLDATSSISGALCVALILTIAALWLSGKNQGEAARLWCFLTPWLLLTIGVQDQDDTWAGDDTNFRWFLCAQLVAGVLTVGSVSGFSF